MLKRPVMVAKNAQKYRRKVRNIRNVNCCCLKNPHGNPALPGNKVFPVKAKALNLGRLNRVKEHSRGLTKIPN